MPNMDKETHFVMRNGKAEYPSVAQENLLVWYDAKGKHNPDRHKDTLLDLSGNNRHAELYNFAYEKKSGYLETPEGGLLFDDVDDKLVYPSVKDEVEYTSASRNLFYFDKLDNRQTTITGLKPNTEYTMSSNVPALTAGNHNLYFGTLSTGVHNGKPVTQTTNSAGEIWFQIYPSRDHTQDLINKTYWIQLEEGATATSYTPYVPLPVMTYQYNGNILSYEADGTVKRVDDGKVITRKGINLVRNGNFANGKEQWSIYLSATARILGDELEMLSGATYSGATEYIYRTNNNADSGIAGHKFYFSACMKTPSHNILLYLNDGVNQTGVTTNNLNVYERVSGIRTIASEAKHLYIKLQDNRLFGENVGKYYLKDVQVVDLTEAYGAGNEPTLEYIQAHPEEFAWTPNPNDLIETHEIKNNLVGDLEDLHGTGDKTEILSGVGEVFTDQADDDSIVHVELEGKSVQPHRFREESGESLVLTNHAEDRPRKLEVLGNTFQNAGSGKNLFIPKGLNSQLTTISNLKPNTAYTMSSNVPNYTVNTLYFNGTGSAGNHVYNSSPKTFTSSNEGTLTYQIYPNRQYTNDLINQKYWIQLEEGSVATAYEPPAPSPNYPIEMKSVGEGLEVYSGISGRNLYKRDSARERTSTRFLDFFLYDILEPYIGEDVVVSFDIKMNSADTPNKLSVYPYQESGISIDRTVHLAPTTTYQRFSMVAKVKNFGKKPNLNLGTLAIYCNAGLTDYSVKNFKVELGATATPYVPAPEEIALNTLSQGVYRTKPNLTAPLRKVGDVADRLFWDATAEKWKVERRVGYREFDGTENWRHQVEDNGYWMAIQGRAKLSRLLASNSFTPLGMKIGMMQPGAATNVLFYYDKGVGGVKGWKAYLAERKSQNNPLNLMYDLEAPVIEILEGGQLPPLFSPTTYLDAISEVKGQMTAGYRLKEGVAPEASDILVAPEYVNPIHSVNDFDVVSSVGKRNLLSNNKFGRYYGGVLLDYDESNYKLIDDTYYIYENPRYSLTGFKIPNPKEEITISGLTSYSSISVFYRGYSKNGVTTLPQTLFDISVHNGEFKSTRRLNSHHDTDYYILGIGVVGNSGNNGWIKLKIEKGSTSTPYSPSPEDITPDTDHPLIDKINLSLSEPLRSVGDVKDRLFRDSDGLWKIERNVGEYEFTGNENVIIRDTTRGVETPYQLYEVQVSSTDAPYANGDWNDSASWYMCSHYKPYHKISDVFFKRVDGLVWDGRVGNFAPRFSIRKVVNGISDVPSFKNWLATEKANMTPVTICYWLKTPTIEILPQADQDKSNNIATYAGSNYVYTVLPDKDVALAEQLQPTIHAKFRKLSWFWSRLLFNQLKIWKRNLTDSELLHEWKQNKKRWGM